MKLFLLSTCLLLESVWLTQSVLAKSTHTQTLSIKNADLPTLTVAQVPDSSSSTCSEAIHNVEIALAEGGYYIPWENPIPSRPTIMPEFRIDDSAIERSYYDYPSDRKQSVTFRLSGDSAKLYRGIMSSPQLLTSYTTQIMAACRQVGLVNYQHWWEGVVPIGYFSDGSVRPFEWVEFRRSGNGSEPGSPVMREVNGRPSWRWGYYFSP